MHFGQTATLLALTAFAGACAPGIPHVDASQKLAAHWAGPVSKGETPSRAWWDSFRDPALASLQRRALINSPSLASAAASVLSARAQARESVGDLAPSVSGSESASASHNPNGAQTGTSRTATSSLDASWEIDLFGRYRAAAAADHARARSAEADYADADLSLLAEVADDYVQYRSCRMTEAAYEENLASERGTLRATEALAKSGLSPQSDLSLARANLASAAITLTSQKATCAGLVQTLAVAVGVPQSEVTSALRKGRGLPRPASLTVRSVPADILRQRPDVVAAEYTLLGKLEDARSAKAQLYPGLSLSGSISLTSGVRSWDFGPTLSLPIFNGGALRAAASKADADAMSSAQSYRSTVLSAVSDVETALVKLSAARRKRADAATAVSEYRAYFKAIDANWRAGGDTLLNRESARREVLNARITEISNSEDALRQLIALYKATGGGWSAAELSHRPVPVAPASGAPASGAASAPKPRP